MLDDIVRRFRADAPAVEAWHLRLVRERSRALMVRRDVLEPVRLATDVGAMVTVRDGGGIGYAATPDLSPAGLGEAAARARDWARFAAGRQVDAGAWPTPRGAWRSRVVEPWSARGLDGAVALLREACRRLARGERIADRIAALSMRESEVVLATSDGAVATQDFAYVVPYLAATANRGGDSQTRSLGRDGGRQGGFERLAEAGFADASERVADEALALLDAPPCPGGAMDLVLTPTQMVLQIHGGIL